MQLNLEHPDNYHTLHYVRGDVIGVDGRDFSRSFVLAPDAAIDDWRPRSVDELTPADLEPMLALNPELLLLGSGPTQRFPAAAIMAACLIRGIGIEVMNNAAAARTFNVLASEGRRVVAGFLLPG